MQRCLPIGAAHIGRRLQAGTAGRALRTAEQAAAQSAARSRIDSAAQIQAAVETAWEGFKVWQRKIGRDVNPSQLIGMLVAAGAKRVVVTNPAYAAVARKECSRLNYEFLGYGGIEDD